MFKIDEAINDYIHRFSSPEDEVLSALNRQTWLDIVQPRMLSGHIQGKILEMISMMIHPKYILEIGTFTGYSAICLAKGLQKDGKLITLEKNDELEEIARTYIHKAGFDDKIILIIGDALEIIPGLKESFDLIFLDGDKKEYINYYQVIISKVKPGGFILVDNVLWDGKVVDPLLYNDTETKAIRQFNEMILNDPQITNVILPVRDGISIIRKK